MSKATKKLAWFCGAALSLLIAGGSANAAPLAVGGNIAASGEADPTGGTVVASLTQPFSSGEIPTPVIVGNLITNVISGDPSNTLGGLTFTFQIQNGGASTGVIQQMTLLDYAGFATDVNYETPEVGVRPATVDRSANGSVVGWRFNVPQTITPGGTSDVLVVQTNAPAFVSQTANIIDGTVATAATFGPAVPEPASLALLALAGLGLVRRRA